MIKLKRTLKYAWQRCTRGFSDRETWSLSGTIAKFALPRLKRFKEVNNCFPYGMTSESWDEEINDIIYAMEFCIEEDGGCDVEKFDIERVNNGLRLFGENFRHLWW